MQFFWVVHFIAVQLLGVVSYCPLYLCNFSLFISNFTDLGPLPFLLDESG